MVFFLVLRLVLWLLPVWKVMAVNLAIIDLRAVDFLLIDQFLQIFYHVSFTIIRFLNFFLLKSLYRISLHAQGLVWVVTWFWEIGLLSMEVEVSSLLDIIFWRLVLFIVLDLVWISDMLFGVGLLKNLLFAAGLTYSLNNLLGILTSFWHLSCRWLLDLLDKLSGG